MYRTVWTSSKFFQELNVKSGITLPDIIQSLPSKVPDYQHGERVKKTMCEESRNHREEHAGMKELLNRIRQSVRTVTVRPQNHFRHLKSRAVSLASRGQHFSQTCLLFKLKLPSILLCELPESSSRSEATPKENKPEQPEDYNWNVALVLPQRSAAASAGAGNMCGVDCGTSR